MRSAVLTSVLGCSCWLVACGSDEGGGGSGGSGAASTGGASGSSGASGAGGSAAGGASGSGGASSGGSSASGGASGAGGTSGSGAGLPYPFRYGINMGHRNASWGDDKEATLSSRAGADSIRVKLPAAHFARWGYDIEEGDLGAYASLGMGHHIGFLIGSDSVEHSVAPAGSADWQNEYYIPKNLYEPIFLANGDVNPDNYWAAYVYQTVSTYKQWVPVWHVWNEPDWVGDWRVTQTWDTDAPQAADLPRFNGSIFDYVRMLRVAREAAKKADPAALIATGGVGYPSFLSAILRYTDNPAGGAVTSEYPAKGGAYIDVLDFHYYPVFSPKSSDASLDDFIASKDALAGVLSDAGVSVRGWNVSENGAPSAATTDYPGVGSPEYARNYLIKMYVGAQAHGIGGVDWFILSNGDAGSDDAFTHMGLYEDIASLSTVDQATKTDSGTAYTTLTSVLAGASYDASATAALAAPAGVRAYVFGAAPRNIVVWAATGAQGEAASASFDVSTETGFDVKAWNGASSTLTPSGGKVTVALTGSPQFLIER